MLNFFHIFAAALLLLTLVMLDAAINAAPAVHCVATALSWYCK